MLSKLAKDVAAYGGIDFVFRAAQLAVLPVYAHLFTVEQFGTLALLQVSTVLLGILFNLGVNNAVQRFYYDESTSLAQRPLLVSTGLAQLITTLLVGLSAAAMIVWALFRAGAFGPEVVGWLVAVALVTVLPEQIAQYTLDAVRLQFAPRRFLAISIIKNFAGLVLGLWLATRWELGVGGVLLGTLVGATLAVPVGIFCIRANLVGTMDIAVARRILRFGLPYVLVGAAFWLFGSMDRWLIAWLSDVRQVGLFSIAIKFAGVIAFMMTAFGLAWSPFAYRMRMESTEYRPFFAQMFVMWFAFLALAGLTTSLFAGEVLMLLTPPSYWAAAPSISICAAALVLYGTTTISITGIQIEQKPMLLTWGAWVAGAINLLVNVVMVPRFGAAGAAIATLLTFLTLGGLYLYWSQQLHPVPLDWTNISYCVFLVAITAAAALQPGGSDLWLVIGKIVLLSLALGGTFALKIVDPRLLRHLVRR